MFSNSNTLRLDSGSKTGSTITLAEARGDNGNLVIVNSAGTTISQIGSFSTNISTTPNEVFGSVTILDSINDINFNGGILLNRIITTDKFYNVIFQGSSDTTVTNDSRLFLILDQSPTIFRNRGNVTLGVNGDDPTTLMDYFIFNGGFDTSGITGVTNLGGNINTNNRDIIIANNSIQASSLLNTYLSSVSYDTTINNNTFLNFLVTDSFLSPQLSFANQANILGLFGYPYANQLPQPVYPSMPGGITLGSVTNVSSTLKLNSGGAGQYGSIIAGNMNINSYLGNTGDNLRIYRRVMFPLLEIFQAATFILEHWQTVITPM